jgi:hypothetical protein
MVALLGKSRTGGSAPGFRVDLGEMSLHHRQASRRPELAA